MKIIYTSPILEHPPAGGPQLRIENSIKALSQICEPLVISRVAEQTIGGREASRYFQALASELLFAPSVAGLSNNRYMRALQRRLRDRRATETDARYILDRADRMNIDVLWFGYGNISYPLIRLIKSARPGLKVVCDTDSVLSRFILRELPFESDKTRRGEIEQRGREKEREECEWVDLCEITTAVSPVDAAYYRSICRHPERVQLFSNVIDLRSYDVCPPPATGFKKPCMYLSGTFGHIHSPMDRGARWVIDEILPRVITAIPNMHLYIVGRGTEATLRNVGHPNVTVVGKTLSVLPYLRHADVALVPLKHESGTRFKILEAGACRIPIVSTVLGAEGLPVQDGRHLLLADDPDAFARAIVRLTLDRVFAGNLAENCRDLVTNNFGIETLKIEALNILQRLKA